MTAHDAKQFEQSLKTLVAVDGKISTLEEASIPFADRGFLYGQGVFETILVSGNNIVAWNEHMARLMKGCARTLIASPSPEALKSAVVEIVKAFHKYNEISTADAQELKLQVRLILTGGTSCDLKIPRDANGSPLSCRVAVLCRPAIVRPAQFDKIGLSLFPVFDSRSAQFIETKSINYLSNMMALEEASVQGFDDAVFFNERNQFTECTTSNFIWINSDDRICGAPVKNQCLPGTSLLCLVRGLIKKGHQFHEDPLSSLQPSLAKACFTISSVRGLTPVGRIGEVKFELEDFQETKDYLNSLMFAEQKSGLVPIY
jgi:branched-chain amino acid aminotransferase